MALGVILLVIIAAASSGSGDSSSSGDSASSSSSSSASNSEPEPENCGSKASDDCTPRVSSNESVEVDALVWSIQSAKTTSSIGDQSLGLAEAADGVFVVVKLKVTSKHDESVDLASVNELVQLTVDGTTYDPDDDGTSATVLDGGESFLLKNLGPDSTTTGEVVFDLPKSKMGKKMELRFNELGFGETHGFIRLPSLS